MQNFCNFCVACIRVPGSFARPSIKQGPQQAASWLTLTLAFMDESGQVLSGAQTISTKETCKASDERPPRASSKALSSSSFLQNAPSVVSIAHVLSGPAIPSGGAGNTFCSSRPPTMPDTTQAWNWCGVNVDGGSSPWGPAWQQWAPPLAS